MSTQPIPVEQLQALTQKQAAQLEVARGEVARLTNLYVALLRLFEETRREKVYDAICEIIISLLGSEDFVVYEARGNGFHPVRGMGAVYETSPALRESDAAVAAALSTGALHVGEGKTTAVVPLLLHGKAALALVAVHGLVRHKSELTGDDLELLKILVTHGAFALAAARED